jgi:hypothetical protein
MGYFSENKIMAALEKIEAQKKNSWYQTALGKLQKVDASVSDVSCIASNLEMLAEVFRDLDTKLEEGSTNIDFHTEICASLASAAQEHMHLLVNHAKEQISANFDS